MNWGQGRRGGEWEQVKKRKGECSRGRTRVNREGKEKNKERGQRESKYQKKRMKRGQQE